MKMVAMFSLFFLTLVSWPVFAQMNLDTLVSDCDYVYIELQKDGTYWVDYQEKYSNFCMVGDGVSDPTYNPDLNKSKDLDGLISRIANPEKPDEKIKLSDFLGVDENMASEFRSLLERGSVFVFVPANGEVKMTVSGSNQSTVQGESASVALKNYIKNSPTSEYDVSFGD